MYHRVRVRRVVVVPVIRVRSAMVLTVSVNVRVAVKVVGRYDLAVLIRRHLPIFNVTLYEGNLAGNDEVLGKRTFLNRLLTVPRPSVTAKAFIAFVCRCRIITLRDLGDCHFVSVFVYRFVSISSFCDLTLGRAAGALLARRDGVRVEDLRLFVVLAARSFVQDRCSSTIRFLNVVGSDVLLVLLSISVRRRDLTQANDVPVDRLVRIVGHGIKRLIPNFYAVVRIVVRGAVRIITGYLQVARVLIRVGFHRRRK